MKNAQIFDRSNISRWLWSALYFAATFIFLHYTAHFWSTFNAWQIGYDPHFSYDGMQSLFHTTGWSAKRVAFVYLAPPIWGFACSIVGFVGFVKTKNINTHLRTFWFWLCFNGFLLYFSYIITGLLSGVESSSEFYTGFVGFYVWLKWKTGTIMGVLIFQVITAVLLALVFPPMILRLNHSRKILSHAMGKLLVLFHVFFAPMVIGTALVWIYTFPMALNYQLVRILCCLPVLGLFLMALQYVEYRGLVIVKGGLVKRPYWQLATVIGVLFFLSEFVFSLELVPVLQ